MNGLNLCHGKLPKDLRAWFANELLALPWLGHAELTIIWLGRLGRSEPWNITYHLRLHIHTLTKILHSATVWGGLVWWQYKYSWVVMNGLAAEWQGPRTGKKVGMVVWDEIRRRHLIWCCHLNVCYGLPRYHPLPVLSSWSRRFDQQRPWVRWSWRRILRLSEGKMPQLKDQLAIPLVKDESKQMIPQRAFFLPQEQDAWSSKWPFSRVSPIASKHLIGVQGPSFSRYEPSPGSINGKPEFNRLFHWWESVETMNKGKETIVCKTSGYNLSAAFFWGFWCKPSESSITP